MLKIFIAFSVIIGQETVLLILLLDNQSLPSDNLTSIEETWEEAHPPVHIFANTLLPDGVTSTAPLVDAYLDGLNTEESTQVDLTEVTWVPSAD